MAENVPMNSQVSLRVAYLFYFGLLIGAMSIACPDINAARIAWMFPFGFAAFFRTSPQGPGAPLVFLAYGLHALFFLLFTAIRQRPWFYLTVTGFVVFLALNVSGCRHMLGEFKGIQ